MPCVSRFVLDAALAQTRTGVEEARTAYEEVRQRLDARAHMTYMEGPVGNVGFLLGAASLADLADRLEFIDAVSQSDMDIANEAENLRLALLAEERHQEALRADQAEVVGDERADLNQLRSQLEEQQRILATVEAAEREAEQAAQVLSRKYQQQVAYAFRGPVGNGSIRVCPVGQPRGFGDDFGAPRYTGGYHPHAGNDIFAPTGTAIYAPFDGFAYDASNGLGGLSVTCGGARATCTTRTSRGSASSGT